MAAETSFESTLRAEQIDTAVKAVALATYRYKLLCTIDTSSSFTESYFRETNDEMSDRTGYSGTDIPRLSPLPYGQVTETKISAIMCKFGRTSFIAWEDELTNNVNMIARTVLRVGRDVAYQVDKKIEALLSSDAGNSYAITIPWNNSAIANIDVIKDILTAAQTIQTDNIDPFDNGYLVVNGTDYISIVSNSKVLNNPAFKIASSVENGVVASIAGFSIMKSEQTTADQCYLVAKGANPLVWKEVSALKVEQIRTPFIKTDISAVCYGTIQLQAPNAICKITNTRD